MSTLPLTTETEWLLTNGLGGYSFGTTAGINTRRYHGLLVAALHPPIHRIVALHSVIAQLEIDGKLVQLSTQLFGEGAARHPDGWKYITGFERRSSDEVVWTFQVGELVIEQRLRIQPRHNAVSLIYQFKGALPTMLRLRPMTPMRGMHEMCHEGPWIPAVKQAGSSSLLLQGGGDVRMRLVSRGTTGIAHARIEPQWWTDVRYPQDRERGQDWNEDLWSPGVFEFEFADVIAHSAGAVECRLDVEIAAPELPMLEPNGSRKLARSPGSAVANNTKESDTLAAAGQQFLVKRLSHDRAGWSNSIVAGYPWFADWGRDAMISLPGLLIIDGRWDEASSVLRIFARSMRHGLIPNCFFEDGSAQYNSVDASLWFIHAVSLLHDNLSTSIRRELVDDCQRIVDAFRRGTEFDISMDSDSLIQAGNPHVQLTWMDAARDGTVFTPRHGKAVEINALWYNALRALAGMSPRPGDTATLNEIADRAQQSFVKQFWWRERNCLHDVLTPADGEFVPDGRLRPNQIFAVSLPHSPLNNSQKRDVVAAVEKRLLTPFGLRTLEPGHADYRGRFEGDLYQRDGSYHQGTVWPWLIGPFCEAKLRANDFDDASKSRVKEIIAPLLGELGQGCIGQLAEIYDGDAPHRRAGCVAQAWSIAEVRRVLWLLQNPKTAEISSKKSVQMQ